MDLVEQMNIEITKKRELEINRFRNFEQSDRMCKVR